MNNPTVLNLLRDVRDTLDDPVFWTQDAAARDERCHTVESTDPKACSWCLGGALERAARTRAASGVPQGRMDLAHSNAQDRLAEAIRNTTPWGREESKGVCLLASRWIIRFNDRETTTFEDVAGVIRKAILAERGA